MMKLTIASGTAEEFFRRGRELAGKLDRGEQIPEEQLLTFEDPADILELVTTGRLALFREVKHEPGSITDLARRLHRDRSAVKRDVDILAAAGLVTVEQRPLPGHGRMKVVRAAAERFSLIAQVG
jgi:predicted transcriptional regulator